MNKNYTEITEKASEIRESKPAEALDLFFKAKKLALLNADEAALTESLFNIGVTYHNLSNHKTSAEYFRKALESNGVNKDKFIHANILRCLGVQYFQMNILEEAIHFLYESEKVSVECGYDENIHMIESTMGSVYIQLQMFDKALEHELKSLKIAEKMNSGSMISYSYLGIGSCYFLMNDLDKAEEFLEKAFGFETTDFARANTYYYLSRVHFERSNYKQAEEFAVKGYEISTKNHILDYKVLCLSMIGSVNRETGNFEKSLQDFNEAINIAEKFANKRIYFGLYKELIALYDKTAEYEKKSEAYEKLYKYHIDYLEIQSRLKIKQLNTEHQIEKAKDEAVIERLKNVELRKALEKVSRLNEELAELNTEKNDFMAIAVHDLKNPLQNILSTAKMLKRTEPNEEQKEYAENIIQQTDRMFNLISKLLNHNIIEEGKIRINKCEFKADSICRDLVNDFKEAAARKNVNINFENRCNGDKIFNDYDILFEIMGNIVSNAVKFSPRNTNVVLRSSAEKGNILFEITDEGPGFSDEDKQRLFRKFSKLSAKPTMGESSTGLGLSIAKKLCKLIGAEIKLESTPGKGASFFIEVNSN
jgi:signal transduction histidine kinase